jgi:hypothetical protein
LHARSLRQQAQLFEFLVEIGLTKINPDEQGWDRIGGFGCVQVERSSAIPTKQAGTLGTITLREADRCRLASNSPHARGQWLK